MNNNASTVLTHYYSDAKQMLSKNCKDAPNDLPIFVT